MQDIFSCFHCEGSKRNGWLIAIIAAVAIAAASLAACGGTSGPGAQDMPSTPPRLTTDNTFDNRY